MTNGVQSIRSLNLHELIGAPLSAMIQADAQAAKSTLEFLETVGFVSPEPGKGEPGEKFEVGKLRMAEFRYKKLDENNQVSEFVASVPVLSLLPLPVLQIKEGKVSFSAKIVDILKEKPNVVKEGAATIGRPAARLTSWINSRMARLLVKPAASSGAKDHEIRGTFHLDIQVSVGQADIPLGMEKIFNLMDQAINEEKPPE